MILGNVYIGFNFGELGQYILRTDVKVYVIVLAPSSSFSKPITFVVCSYTLPALYSLYLDLRRTRAPHSLPTRYLSIFNQ